MNSDFNIKNYDNLKKREILQSLFDSSFTKAEKNSLRMHYQALRNLELEGDFSFEPDTFSVSLLVESITNACDIFCIDYNKNFIFCGDDTCTIKGNQRLITKAILCLLSNGFIYGRGSLITTNAFSKNGFIHIEIQSAGTLSPDFSFKDGLTFVKRVCKAHHGHFFIKTTNVCTSAIMLIPEATSFKEGAPTPDIFDLLSDRLSPVYVEFFGQK